MATLTALIFWALAVAVASLDLHELIANPRLHEFQDPRKFISNDSDVYLLSVSVPGSYENERPQFPCVRSRYRNKTKGKVERSLDVYNKTNLSHSSSINISLTVEEEGWQKNS
uniref:Lipocalin n=1 Tax=Rhipicephalus zambeziensis TaxID=60191 RepID=A0A224YN52_9ACAR